MENNVTRLTGGLTDEPTHFRSERGFYGFLDQKCYMYPSKNSGPHVDLICYTCIVHLFGLPLPNAESTSETHRYK